jgi:type I restriction enzyme S subunit
MLFQPNNYKPFADLFPNQLVESELCEIPEGWEYKKLKEICRVINGRAYKNTEFKTSGTPIVRIQNITGGGKTVYSDLDLPSDKLISKEDFIYAWSATFGPHIWRGEKSIYHYHIWKMEVDESYISRYFMYLSMFRKTEGMKSAGTGSIFTHLTKGLMEGQDILIGSEKINKSFGQLIEPIYKKITALNAEINSLTQLKDTLLPKLLSGEIDLATNQKEVVNG